MVCGRSGRRHSPPSRSPHLLWPDDAPRLDRRGRLSPLSTRHGPFGSPWTHRSGGKEKPRRSISDGAFECGVPNSHVRSGYQQRRPLPARSLGSRSVQPLRRRPRPLPGLSEGSRSVMPVRRPRPRPTASVGSRSVWAWAGVPTAIRATVPTTAPPSTLPMKDRRETLRKSLIPLSRWAHARRAHRACVQAAQGNSRFFGGVAVPGAITFATVAGAATTESDLPYR